MTDVLYPTRRQIFTLASAGAASLALPGWALAQSSDPIKIAALLPLTGGGGAYGPSMQRAAELVVNEVNAAGGVLGRKVQLLTEDDQTNPDAAVRGARKLIDADKVCAIVGTWASSVTTAVAPLCWENKVFLATVSGGENITNMPHQGYIIRTQPTSGLLGKVFADFIAEQGGKKAYFMGPQTPLSQSYGDHIEQQMKKLGGISQTLLYEDKKSTYRTEVSQVIRTNPDFIVLGGYVPDTSVVVKEIYRAGYKGKIVGMAFGVNQKLVEAVPPETLENVYMIGSSPAVGSETYKRLANLMKSESLDPYTCQVYDHVNLVLMAIAKAKQASGTAIKDAVRSAARNKGGRSIDNAVDGIKAIAANQPIIYSGASGSCEFTEKGDVINTFFRYEQIRGGKINLVKVA
jgi:branched-chain amino acid transport system substrate-binding protein